MITKGQSTYLDDPATKHWRNNFACGLRGASRILLLCMVHVLHAVAAEPRVIRLPITEGKDIRFTHLSTEEGLSQSRVDHMLQDAQGFLWIGTYNGLNRYDGYRFQHYKPEANNPNGMGGVYIHALFQDRSGALWIAVDQGLDRFDPVTGRFFHFRSDPGDPTSLAGHVEHITQDSDGMLWLAKRNGLDRLDPSSGRFTHFRNDPNDPQSLSSIRAPRQAGHTLGCDRRGARRVRSTNWESHSSLSESPAATAGPDLRRSFRDALAQCDTRWRSNLARSEDRAVHNVHLF